MIILDNRNTTQRQPYTVCILNKIKQDTLRICFEDYVVYLVHKIYSQTITVLIYGVVVWGQ